MIALPPLILLKLNEQQEKEHIVAFNFDAGTYRHWWNLSWWSLQIKAILEQVDCVDENVGVEG